MASKAAPTNEQANISIAKHRILSPNGHIDWLQWCQDDFSVKKQQSKTWENYFHKGIWAWNCDPEIVESQLDFYQQSEKAKLSNFLLFLVFLYISVYS